MSVPHKETAAEILRSFKHPQDCMIKCRLCGARVVDDPPDEVWQGFKPGLGGGSADIDEHEKCDALAKIIENDKDFEAKLEAYFAAAGDDPVERARAQRVLEWRRGKRYV